ncbi:uncharacterized protein LOC126750068 isoform X1 [Anthonomus grandis grandis]|uniref:uncharacterized protein LOC126750068 isoform X1 n=1 Tax=Anthonomus grandis grandis TaxID=2921223 RepID=UPI00216607D6|nr:uncharacterized protein LOC126750068 isoform X1 [Anthonomus grandis grandis]
MTDTVKKSRIVSEEEKDLEESLLEEFNLRLKNCMSQDDLQKEAEPPEPDAIYQNITSPTKTSPKKHIVDTDNFILNEIRAENHYDVPKPLNGTNQNGHHDEVEEEEEEIYECIPEKTDYSDQNYTRMIDNSKEDVDLSAMTTVEEYINMSVQETSNIYETVEITTTKKLTPTLNLPTTLFTDCSEEKSPDKDQKCSAKDRMLLSCDETSTLLFTQTVTSPMLTPSEENIDFLKGFQRENTISESTTSNVSPPKEEATETSPEVSEPLEEEKNTSSENFYENVQFFKNTTPPNQYENVVIVNRDVEIVEEDNCDSTNEDVYQNIEEVLGEEILRKDDTDEGSLEEFIQHERAVSESFIVRKESPKVDDQVDHINIEEEPIVEESCLMETQTFAALEDDPVITNGHKTITESSSKEKLTTECYKELIYHHKSETTSNYYEKYTEGLSKSSKSDSGINREKDTETVPAEIVKNLKSQFLTKAAVEVVGVVHKEGGKKEAETKSGANMIDQIKTRFESSTDGGKIADESTEYSETIVETNAPGEKCIKKKKVKKTRKEEKENISVTQNGGSLDGEKFYNVNVKNLCRSFGDLTKLERHRNNRKNSDRMRTKSLTDMVPHPNQKNIIDNVFTGVSVRTLKEKFNTDGGTNLINCRFKDPKVKSSFSKFDALQKKNVLHVRSSDSTKAQEKFNGSQIEMSTNCKVCGKQVFQMEQIKAERSVYHKNCFRCSECSKQLTVDTYESNDGSLYCKPHFKALFAPKVVEEEPSQKPRRPELIIRESQPVELPPDVVRASDKPDLGLEELQSLNVKERFQVFEQFQSHHSETSELERAQNVKRSPSILSKLAKFQKHGMDIGVSNEALDGIPIEESESDEEEEEEIPEGEDPDLVRAKRVQKEKPFHFTGMSDVKKRWEQGDHAREERREETKQEIQNIRTKLFMGKQEKMKEAYQQAVMESESSTNVRKNITDKIEACDTKSLKERFEKGEVVNEKTGKERNEEEEVFESEISKKSRSLFLELDASASKPPQLSPVTPPKLEVKKAREAYIEKTSKEDTVKSTQLIEEVEVKTADIQERFKFFETYKEPEKQKKQFRITPPRDPSQVKTETPEREIYRDPDVIRSEEYVDDSKIAKETHTASKMLNKFRQMEENGTREPEIQGPKPLKCFTPPPEPARPESRSEEEESSEYEEEEEEEEEVDTTGKLPEDIIEAQKAARAKQLRAKFERWEANEIKKEQQNVNIVEEFGEEQSQIESTRVLRARFEQMREVSTESSKSPRVKPNRFVEISTTITETCQSCQEKVYPLEKISIHGNIYHKGCFKCMECSCVLRMDSYSYNQGLLYCTPHFKRLFISKGNYDSAFGLDQHKEKWQNGTTVA